MWGAASSVLRLLKGTDGLGVWSRALILYRLTDPCIALEGAKARGGGLFSSCGLMPGLVVFSFIGLCMCIRVWQEGQEKRSSTRSSFLLLPNPDRRLWIFDRMPAAQENKNAQI